jgi:hypothetical protein
VRWASPLAAFCRSSVGVASSRQPRLAAKPFQIRRSASARGRPPSADPGEDFLVGAAGEDAGFQSLVIDPKKMAEPAVEALAEVFVVIGMQRAAGVQADLVERARQEVQAAELSEGGDGTLVHGGGVAGKEIAPWPGAAGTVTSGGTRR